MNGSHAIRAVRANNCQVGHADLPLASLLYKTDSLNTSFITGEVVANFTEQTLVDLENDFQLAGKHRLKPGERPFLQSLWQQCVIGVSQCLFGKTPRLIPIEARFIEQYAHEFRN